jgi:cytochrome P450
VDAEAAPAATDWLVPDHVPEELIHPFDHWSDPSYIADPIGYFDPLRRRFRVFWSPRLGGFWCLTRYDDIHSAFQQPDLFSSRLTNIPGREVRLLPISLDPPEHTKYRRVLNKPFGPAAIEDLSGQIRQRCADMVDAVVRNGPRVDFIDALAQPLPTTMFCQLLGLPMEDVEKFLEWNYTILHVSGTPERAARFQQANEELNLFLNDLVAFRKTHPGDDLVTRMLSEEVDGRPLTHAEALAMAYLLFMAGLDTVTSALGWSWKFLAEHPAHRQQIVDDPALIPGAVEEILRCYSFVEDARTLTRDAEFAGVTMRAGDRIMLPTSSAGRDESQFPHALEVDFHRYPNRHIAFASGPHRCLGSHLARAELHIAMEEWHRRITNYRIAAGAEIVFHGGAVVGPDTLPLEIVKAD